MKTMVRLVNPQIGETIYDPFCGTGGFLIESFRHIYNNMARTESNLKILNLIQRILKLPKEKVPTCLDEFGNTSSASIPMTIVSRLSEKLNRNKKDITCCGYGVGLSWATLNMQVSNIKIPKVIFMANEEKDMNHLA